MSQTAPEGTKYVEYKLPQSESLGMRVGEYAGVAVVMAVANVEEPTLRLREDYKDTFYLSRSGRHYDITDLAEPSGGYRDEAARAGGGIRTLQLLLPHQSSTAMDYDLTIFGSLEAKRNGRPLPARNFLAKVGARALLEGVDAAYIRVEGGDVELRDVTSQRYGAQVLAPRGTVAVLGESNAPMGWWLVAGDEGSF